MRKIKDYVMSERGNKAVNAILLTIIAVLMTGLFGIGLWFLDNSNTMQDNFIKSQQEFSKAVKEMSRTQNEHVLHESSKNNKQDLKINENTHDIKELKEDNKLIKTKIGIF